MDRREKRLPAIRPNIGLEAEFRRKLNTLIEEMNESAVYWLKATYKANEPVIAQDELPAAALKKAMRTLATRWQKRFDEMAPKLAEWFAKAAAQRSDIALKRILRQGGLTVKFQMTKAMRDILQASINQQISLIKSIPQQYLTQVEGAVMRSVTTGRDLGALAKELQDHYGVAKRRSALIARTQNNMATSAMTRARQQELGLKAIWVHSHGGKEPRPTHVKMDGRKYDPAKGMYDPAEDRFIWPGELINCRCVSRAVVPGLT